MPIPPVGGPGAGRPNDTRKPAGGFDEALRQQERELGVTRTPKPEKPPKGPQPLEDSPPPLPPPPPPPPHHPGFP